MGARERLVPSITLEANARLGTQVPSPGHQPDQFAN